MLRRDSNCAKYLAFENIRLVSFQFVSDHAELNYSDAQNSKENMRNISTAKYFAQLEIPPYGSERALFIIPGTFPLSFRERSRERSHFHYRERSQLVLFVKRRSNGLSIV